MNRQASVSMPGACDERWRTADVPGLDDWRVS